MAGRKNRNVEVVVVRQGESLDTFAGKGPKGSGLGAAGKRRDEGVAEGKEQGCSWEVAVEVVLGRGCGMGRCRAAGEKQSLGCLTSLPSVCTCNTKNRVISDTWMTLYMYTRRTLAGMFGSKRCGRGAGRGEEGGGGGSGEE